MNTPFRLVLPVDQVNAGPETEAIDVFTVNATLQHTIGDLKELVWLFSPDHALKPIFIRFTVDGASVSDSDTLLGFMNLLDILTGNVSHPIRMVIDYTLFKSPFIPQRDPVPTMFDVEATYAKHGKTKFLRETLLSSVAAVKEDLASLFGLDPGAYDLLLNGEVLDTSTTLREALALDVTPKQVVKFDVARRPEILSLSARNLESEAEPIQVSVSSSASVHELKTAISQQTHRPALALELYHALHLVSTALRIPDLRPVSDLDLQDEDALVFRVQPGFVEVAGEIWTPTGRNFSEIRTENVTKLIDSGALSSAQYELEMDGEKVHLSTADCIMDPARGVVLVSPLGQAKLRATWSQISGKRGTWVEPENQHGTGFTAGIRRGREEEAEEINGDQTGAAARAETADGVHDPGNAHEEQNFQFDPRDGALRRLLAALHLHFPRLVNFFTQVVFFLIFFGLELLAMLLEPLRITTALVFLMFVLYFWLGNDIADWMDAHLLENAPPRWDFAVVRFQANVFRRTHGFYARLEALITNLIRRMTLPLLRHRHIRFALRNRRGHSWWASCADAALQIAAGMVIYIATLLPKLTEECAKMLEELDREDTTFLAQEVERFNSLNSVDNPIPVSSCTQQQLVSIYMQNVQ